MGELLARAQEYISVTAICDYVDSNGNICGKPATETQRFVDGELAGLNNPTILVGDTEFYAPRCIGHHKVPNRPKYNEK
jgi:thymidine kinase